MCSHRDLWSKPPTKLIEDAYGYGRIPAFWFTLNLAYNHAFDVHRFHEAVALVAGLVPDEACLAAATANTHQARSYRCNWVRNNADIVAFVHALRVELQVRLVMQHVVPCQESEPFLYWLRFEWGANGNPHAHGQCYVSGNPSFESVVEDQATADFLRTRGSGDALAFRTKDEAEAELGEFFGKHLSEWHPAKTAQGDATYNYVVEVLRNADLEQPQCVDLYTVLDTVLAGDDEGISLQPLHHLLVSLVENSGNGTPVTALAHPSTVPILALVKGPSRTALTTFTVATCFRACYASSPNCREQWSRTTHTDQG